MVGYAGSKVTVHTLSVVVLAPSVFLHVWPPCLICPSLLAHFPRSLALALAQPWPKLHVNCCLFKVCRKILVRLRPTSPDIVLAVQLFRRQLTDCVRYSAYNPNHCCYPQCRAWCLFCPPLSPPLHHTNVFPGANHPTLGLMKHSNKTFNMLLSLFLC